VTRSESEAHQQMHNSDLISQLSTGTITPRDFYMKTNWERKAAQIIRRDRGECQSCRRRGKYRRAECVHHKIELKKRPDLAFDDDNLESLCKPCHNLAHDKGRKITPKASGFTTPERW